MKIKILPKVIVANIDSEDNLIDLSIMKSFYAIRALKVAAFFGSDTVVEIKETNDYGQVYIEQFQIWIKKEEYVEV